MNEIKIIRKLITESTRNGKFDSFSSGGKVTVNKKEK